MFHIDENAYVRLERYLNTLKQQFVNTEGGNEIINDIETRIAELFKERTGPGKEVINAEDVDQVIAIMGQPEDYLEMDDEANGPTTPPYTEYASPKKRIFRDVDNRIIGGVSSGLAAYFNIDAIWIRILFLIALFSGFGFLLYIIMWAVIPKAQTTAEKLQMRGEKINISNIEKSIREEMEGVNEGFKNVGSRMQSHDYRRSSNQLGNFFSDLGNFIVDALKLIFKFLGKLIGLIFLFIGSMILIALVVGLFAGSVEIMGSGYGMGELFDFLHLVTASEGHYNLLIIGIILSVIAPFFLLIYLGIRILFNLEPLNSPARSALSVTTFVGLILLVVAGVRIGLEFDSHGYVSDELALPTHQEYHILLAEDSINEGFADHYPSHWISHNGRNAFDHVRVDIKPTIDSLPYLEIISEAHGPTRREARNNARNMNYKVKIQDSTIEIPGYLVLGRDEKYRNQEVELILYLPEGFSVFIDESLAEVLYDVENVQNTWDFEMANKRWIMTDKGLSCEGCEIPTKDIPEEESWDEEIQMDLDSDEIDLKIKIGENGKLNLNTSFTEIHEKKNRSAIGILYEERQRIVAI